LRRDEERATALLGLDWTAKLLPPNHEVLMRLATIGLAAVLISARAGAEWRYEEIKSDGDRTTAYLLQTDSSLAVKGANGKEHYPFMQLRCDEDGGQPYWRIQWFGIIDTKIGSDSSRGAVDNVRLQVRVDGKPDYRDVWDMTRDESLEGVTTTRASALVKTLREANELRIRISGGYGKTYDATFDVSGLEAALEQLKAHCKRL
jgi:hypothetical protein